MSFCCHWMTQSFGSGGLPTPQAVQISFGEQAFWCTARITFASWQAALCIPHLLPQQASELRYILYPLIRS